MRVVSFGAALAGVLMFAGCVGSSSEKSSKVGASEGDDLAISWRVENPLPLFDNSADAASYLTIFDRIKGRERVWAGPDPFSPIETRSTPFPIGWVAEEHGYREGLPPTDLRVVVSVNAAPVGARCVWTLDGVPQSGSTCNELVLSFPVFGGETDKIYSVAVDISERDGSKHSLGPEPVMPKHLTLVSIGDSYASGEGVPDVHSYVSAPPSHPHVFWDSRCHRSMFSGPALAAAALVHEDPHLAVTFFSYACSGAEIDKGLLRSYAGRETWAQLDALYRSNRDYRDRQTLPPISRDELLPPQIEAARNDLRGRKPDYVVVSVGGNDIGFGSLVRDMLFERCNINADGTPSNCRQRMADRLSDAKIGLPALDGAYATLARNLSESISSRHVLITEYPDLTKDENGQFCDDTENDWPDFIDNSPTFFGRGEIRLLRFPSIFSDRIPRLQITGSETEFASREVIVKLNERVGAAAAANGWKLVDGLAAASSKHGYCSSTPYFNTYSKSLARQGELKPVPGRDAVSSGAAHPNVLGSRLYACFIAARIMAVEAGEPDGKRYVWPKACADLAM